MIFKMLKRLRFRNYRLSSKLIVTYIILTVIPMSLMGYISYWQYTKSIQEQLGEYMPRFLEQAGANIEKQMNEIVNLPELLYNSNDIIAILRRDHYQNQSDLLKDQFVVNSYMASTYLNGSNPNVLGVFLISKNRFFHSTRLNFSGFGLDTLPVPSGNDLDWQGKTKIILPNEVHLKFDGNVPYIMIMKQIQDFDNRKNMGTMFIAVRLKFIDEILRNFEKEDKAALWIMNKTGKILYHTDNNKIGSIDQEINQYPILNGSFRSNATDESRLVSVKEFSQYQWVLVHSIPLKYLTERTDLVRNITILMFLIFITITSIISIFFALKVTRPIKKLSGLMKYVEMGNFQVDLKIRSRDEVGMLARSFNSMVATTRELIEKNYYIEIKQKEAELYALQSQINPHFMYNTLETIGMAVEEGETGLVVEMVTLLGRMLRFSLSNKSKLVTIDEEVQHVRDYLTIQKIRFEDRVNFMIDPKIDIHLLYTPKFILQPIVENAIKHGLELRKGVHIQISINQEFGAGSGKQEIVFRIRDDGPGIPADKLAELNDLMRSEAFVAGDSGLGLRNVHARIALMFGADFGVQLDSLYGKGTEVIIRIPVYGGEQL
ncbi:cache domain-containing sensor histidine kinase [Ferviditalea candida]|uniref:histidine kinase n=1 Tax=Ferviditalea candida TaxID=3108399 RepID=A0ABU5ZN04_9BACL|nr:sensor histidine kinase [Paenibacillaceae bacterium T2]